jgi:outer membrane protein insertion porin family
MLIRRSRAQAVSGPASNSDDAHRIPDARAVAGLHSESAMKITNSVTRSLLHRLARFTTVCAFFIVAGSLGAQQMPKNRDCRCVIERLELIGYRRIDGRALRVQLRSREGEPYTTRVTQRDFLRLWNTHLFSDVRVEVKDSPDRPGAKIVIFYLKEKPIIRRIEYRGIKSITESEIVSALKDAGIDLSVEERFDPAELTAAAVIIKGLLALHGRPFAIVKNSYERIPRTDSVSVAFDVDDEPKDSGPVDLH